MREFRGEAKQVLKTTLGLGQALPLSVSQTWSYSWFPFLTNDAQGSTGTTRVWAMACAHRVTHMPGLLLP